MRSRRAPELRSRCKRGLACAGLLLLGAWCIAGAQEAGKPAAAPAGAAPHAVAAPAAPSRYEDWTGVALDGPSPPAETFAHGTFWRIEKQGALQGYVLGTLHIGDPDRLGVPAEAYSRLAEAGALVVEIAPAGYSAERAEALRSLPAGGHLRALVGEPSFALAEHLAKAARLDATALARMQPWAALALLQAASHLPDRSLDDTLIARAEALGLEVVGLETLEEQFGAFACVSLEAQALVMRETLAVHERFREFNDETLRLYREQDVRALMSYLVSSVPLSAAAKAVDAEVTRCVIDARNRSMTERLDELLGDRVLFVAIGVLHLTGAEGVLARLASRGFRIVRGPVEPPPARDAAGPPATGDEDRLWD